MSVVIDIVSFSLSHSQTSCKKKELMHVVPFRPSCVGPAEPTETCVTPAPLAPPVHYGPHVSPRVGPSLIFPLDIQLFPVPAPVCTSCATLRTWLFVSFLEALLASSFVPHLSVSRGLPERVPLWLAESQHVAGSAHFATSPLAEPGNGVLRSVSIFVSPSSGALASVRSSLVQPLVARTARAALPSAPQTAITRSP